MKKLLLITALTLATAYTQASNPTYTYTQCANLVNGKAIRPIDTTWQNDCMTIITNQVNILAAQLKYAKNQADSTKYYNQWMDALTTRASLAAIIDPETATQLAPTLGGPVIATPSTPTNLPLNAIKVPAITDKLAWTDFVPVNQFLNQSDFVKTYLPAAFPLSSKNQYAALTNAFYANQKLLNGYAYQSYNPAILQLINLLNATQGALNKQLTLLHLQYAYNVLTPADKVKVANLLSKFVNQQLTIDVIKTNAQPIVVILNAALTAQNQ